MRRLAAVGAGDGLDVLGPLPARLERRSPHAAFIHGDQLKVAGAVLERPCLFRCVEALPHETSHHCLPLSSVWTPTARRASERAIGHRDAHGHKGRRSLTVEHIAWLRERRNASARYYAAMPLVSPRSSS